MMIRWVFAVLIALSAGCLEEEWNGFVYPDAENLKEHSVVGKFKSRDECIRSAQASITPVGTFECGLNCQDSEFVVKVCEKQ